MKRFPLALADPRFGLVAPGPLIGLGSSAARLDAGGTGPFEYRGARTGDRCCWPATPTGGGRPLGLGPGVDQVELTVDPGAGQRVAELLGGTVEVADDARAPRRSKRIEAAPLLTAVAAAGSTVGLERSVRGIDSAAAVQSLADVWLTDLR